MKVVFIVHYFPPLNSTGARRVLALSKYLSRFGHEVTVLTTHKTNSDGYLTEELPGYCRVIELGRGKLSCSPSSNVCGASAGRSPIANALVSLRRMLTLIFGQLIDHRVFFALIFRRRKLPGEVSDALANSDVIVSSHPPWPVHLAAYFCAQRFNKPWVADYRDQFSGAHFFSGNFISRKVEVWLERHLLSSASAVTVISQPMAEYYRTFHDHVITIENGFDEELFNDTRARMTISGSPEQPSCCYIRFMGRIHPGRIPRNLFAALRALPKDNRAKIQVEFYGQNRLLMTIMQTEFADLDDVVTLKGEVPYNESLRLILDASALFITETSSNDSLSTKGILTTKLFEYLAANRPIIADIQPDTLIGEVIGKSGLGLVCSTNPYELKQALINLQEGDYDLKPNATFIATFSREAQAKRFEHVLREVCA